MIIGLPREIKDNEYRVALVPSGVRSLVEHGHHVIVEKAAGEGSGLADEYYRQVGAEIVEEARAVFGQADMIVKVKEPQAPEWDLLQEHQILFTYLHLAPAVELTKALLEKKVTGIAYETVELSDGSLPLLEPMSEIAGKLSVQVGACCLEREHGGSGVLLGGVPGVRPARVVIIGAGTVGINAARIAVGMGASVTVLDVNLKKLRRLAEVFGDKLVTIASNRSAIEAAVQEADLVVGATLKHGAKAEKLITRDMLPTMRRGSVLVDVAVDQGGCCETSLPTTHEHPTFVVDGVVHYCVANIPSAVSHSSTLALTNATFPYVLELADLGFERAVRQDAALARGLNTCDGKLVSAAVADSQGLLHTPFDTIVSPVR
jgi:alanine dehydrogenase